MISQQSNHLQQHQQHFQQLQHQQLQHQQSLYNKMNANPGLIGVGAGLGGYKSAGSLLNDQENIGHNYQNIAGGMMSAMPSSATAHHPVKIPSPPLANSLAQQQQQPPTSSLITQSMVIGRAPSNIQVQQTQQQQVMQPPSSSSSSSSTAQQPTEPIIVRETQTVNDRVVVRQYKQGEFLGKGGFARCYLMTDMENGKVYAAKIIPKATLVKSRARAKLKSEIKIHSSLNHENIVKFEHCFENEENVYILLGLCNQKTVMDLHKKRKYVYEYEAKYYLYQVILAVKYLHNQKIIHRDLKLGNLFIDNMKIKLGDFGLSTKIEHDGERKKTICGTPNYIAPEILENSSGHSYEVDIWSIGIILYTLLIGKPPFETPDVKNTYQRIRKNQYNFPPEPVISNSAKSLIISILNPVPEKRPNLNQILEHDFFCLSTIPKSLPVSSLTTAPPPPSQISTSVNFNSTTPTSNTMNMRPLSEKTNSVLNVAASPTKSSSSSGGIPQSPQKKQQFNQKANAMTSALGNPNIIPSLSPNSQQKLLDLENDDVHYRKLRRLERIKENDLKTKLLKQQFINTTSMSNTNDPTFNETENNQIKDLESKIANNHITDNHHQSKYQQSEYDYMMIDENGQRVEFVNSVPSNLIYILQFSDITNKYGIGYILSNGFVGSYFNDSTKIISYMDSGVAHYMEHAKGTHGDGRRLLNINETHPHDTQKKVTLIKYFSNFLNSILTESQTNYLNTLYSFNKLNLSTNTNHNGNPDQPGSEPNKEANQQPNSMINVNNYLKSPVYVKKWIKTNNGMGFRLSDSTVQINFIDKSIIIITFDQMVTHITYSPQYSAKTAKLSYFLTQNVDEKIVNKIMFAKELMNNKLCSKKPEVMFSQFNSKK